MSKELLFENGCNTDAQTMAIFVDKNGSCHILSGSDISNDADFSVADTNDNNGIDINYNGGDGSYNFKLSIGCDSSAVPPRLKNESFSVDGRNIFGTFRSSTGCKTG